MKTEEHVVPFGLGMIAGCMILVITLVATGYWPGDAYVRGVKDCATGKVTIQVFSDTVVVTP